MSFSPRFQDDLAPAMGFIFTDDDDNVVPIDGATFQIILRAKPGVDQPSVPQRTVGGGQFQLYTDGKDGRVIYAPIQADVHVPGQYLVYCKATKGGQPMTSDAEPLLINPAP